MDQISKLDLEIKQIIEHLIPNDPNLSDLKLAAELQKNYGLDLDSLKKLLEGKYKYAWSRSTDM